ncbi:MAG: DUF4136 domain-containing protein [Halioglobus sp.]
MSFPYTARSVFGCLLLWISACASTPPSATTDFDARYDFSSVRAIAIQPIDRSTPATVVISDMQIDRINAALTSELQRRGYTVTPSQAEADMLLAWHLVTEERGDVTRFNVSTGYSCYSCGVGVGIGTSVQRPHLRGSFIVDMIDPLQLRSVWRATLETRLDRDSDAIEAREYRTAAARAVFAEFPPP